MKKPNIILINCDDLGYGDLGCYGSKLNRTPALDRMAAEGVRFTDFYMASSVCSPSRGAMMTGCYPNRIGFDFFQGQWVLFPGQAVGLSPKEKTVASYLRDCGYATALIGKWHCGDQPEFLPTRHGFDSYFGIPYSNDMGRQSRKNIDWVHHLQRQIGVNFAGPGKTELDDNYPPLPLLHDGEIVQEQPDQAALTERYVGEAVRFIRENKERPFFLYFAHMYVHLPIYTPEAYLKNSRNGRYGAAVEHVDWSIAALLDELRRQGLDGNTLVIFTSDNGSRARDEGGSNEPLRGTKGTTWEGGQRLPCIMRWPDVIAPGRTCGELITSMDFLPTFVGLAGGEVSKERVIDGRDISPLIHGQTGATSPHEAFYYYHCGTLEAIRSGDWKLHFSKQGEKLCALYDLAADIGETTDLSENHPEIVKRLSALGYSIRQRLGDRAQGIEGSERRPIGQVDKSAPLTCYDPDHPYIIAEYDLADAG
ncbi:MAG: sulfatase [Planctomycetes bacterium]|nr:sulfatase [Planctomycetota bacterium]